MKKDEKINKLISAFAAITALGLTAFACYKFGYITGTTELSESLVDYMNSTLDWEPDIMMSIMHDFNPMIIREE